MALSLQIDTSQPIHQQYIPFNQDHLMERIILPLPLAVPNYLVNFLGPPTSCRHSLGGVLQNVISRLLYFASRLTNMAFALFLLVPLPPLSRTKMLATKKGTNHLIAAAAVLMMTLLSPPAKTRCC
jgi:Zn-dependent protease